ncbi:MAG: hypothetical protein HKN48_07235 [Flavobacteriaceae bacterium]|nr:hypothetical protein [Flavobacteriaceae bacterium]
MNFNYSYRAFLITCLLVGNLVLLLVSVKLTKKVEIVEEVVPIEYAETMEDEEVAINTSEKVKIETNTAYNEAEKFISELEDSRNGATENSEELKNTEFDTESISESLAINQAKSKLESVKKKLSRTTKKSAAAKSVAGINKKTTIRYSLADRKPLYLPNPVYTCDSGGKIVVSIEVSELGKIVKASFNKSLSTTTNGCLIDSALEYAEKAKFTTDSGMKKQKGTITYLFPGQN